MFPLRALPAVLLTALCGQAFGDEPTATEACLNLAHRSLSGNAQQEQRWREVWVDAKATREESYDGEFEGQRAEKRIQLMLRRNKAEDGLLTCLLNADNRAISAQFQAQSDAR